jgi:glutamate--cysteine ligase
MCAEVSADPVGVNQNKLRFLEIFCAFCLMRDSPLIDAGEQSALDQNHVTVARRGREPGLQLSSEGRDIGMREWALEILDGMQGIAEMLDEGDSARPYAAALAAQAAKVHDVQLTPSARLIEELRTTGESFFDLALRVSGEHKKYFLDLYPPNEPRLDEFRREADESHDAATAVVRASTGTFDEYLAKYFA